MPVLIYSSSWSHVKPLVYSDDSYDDAANKLIDAIVKNSIRRKNCLVFHNNKIYYKPSKSYKKYVIRMRKIR